MWALLIPPSPSYCAQVWRRVFVCFVSMLLIDNTLGFVSATLPPRTCENRAAAARGDDSFRQIGCNVNVSLLTTNRCCCPIEREFDRVDFRLRAGLHALPDSDALKCTPTRPIYYDDEFWNWRKPSQAAFFFCLLIHTTNCEGMLLANDVVCKQACSCRTSTGANPVVAPTDFFFCQFQLRNLRTSLSRLETHNGPIEGRILSNLRHCVIHTLHTTAVTCGYRPVAFVRSP